MHGFLNVMVGGLRSLRLHRGGHIELAELLRLHSRRGTGEKFDPSVVLWKGDDFANRLFTGDERHKTVKSKSDPTMWRGAVTEGAQQVAEEFLLLHRADA